MNLVIKDLSTYKYSVDFFEQKPSRSISVFILSILLLLILVFVWAIFFPLEDVIKAQAVIRPVKEVSTIKGLVSGLITKKSFHNGQNVKQGDLLFEYDCTNDKKEVIVLKNQIQKISNELSEQNDLLLYIQNDSYQGKDNLPIDVFKSEKLNYLVKLKMLTEKLENEKSMPEFLLNQNNIVLAENELLQFQATFDSWLNGKAVSVKEYINNLEKTYESLIQQKNSKEKVISDSIIVSPINGYVEEIKELNVFDNVLAGEEILRIIPYDEEELKVEIAVNASAVPRLEINQKVYLRFAGLSTNEFGNLETTIKMIPVDMTVQNNTPIFVIEADLDKPFLVSKKGEVMKLRPGIIADARIVTHKETVLKMILKKLDFIS